MSSLNKIILIGDVTEQPESKVTSGGDAYSRFRMKVTRPERNDGLTPQADVIPVVAWRQVAEKTQNIQSNTRVLVEGKIITRTLDDEEGRRQWITEVEAREIVAVATGSAPADFSPAPDTEAAPEAVSATEPATDQSALEDKFIEDIKESDFDFGASQETQSKEESGEFEKSMDEEIPF